MDLSIIKKAIGNFKAIHGRTPTAAEMAQLEQQALRFTQPTSGLRTGMSAQPRAAYELGTDPNLINPDTARDPFLTKSAFDRTPKGTRLRPITQDITDPSVMQNIEARQLSGKLADDLPNVESTTPTSDYLARMSTGIENEALSGGSLEKLKEAFAQKQGRYPDQDELNALIAEFNPARHQYGSEGISIMSQRPPTAKGMTDWRNAARLEGVPESYLTKRQGNYPQYIQDELQIQRGELPTTGMAEAKKKSRKEVEPVDFYIDENGNVVKIYPTMKNEGGLITPRDMLAQMVVNQITPQKFKNGGSSDEQWRKIQNSVNKTNAKAIEDYTSVPSMMDKMELMGAVDEAKYGPSFREQPFSFSQAFRNKLAPVIGDRNVDKIIGGPQSNLASEAIRTLNPLTYGLGFGDAMVDASKAAANNDPVDFAENYGYGVLNLLPFAGKSLGVGQRLMQVANPTTNKLGIAMTALPEIPKYLNPKK